jgi:uncharacterized membrane protein YqjE
MATPTDNSELGQAIQDVTDKASLLIREEIELAKTEVTEKVTKLIKGAVVGIVAGIFAVFGLIYLLNAASWAIWEAIGTDTNFWIGFLIVAGVLFLLGALAGFMAARLVKRGAPPTPQMAIEEGKLIKETVTTSHPATPQGPS